MDLVKVAGAILGSIVVALLSAAVAAILITCVWNWLIVPVTSGREIGFAEGMGLYIVLGIINQLLSVSRLQFDDIQADSFAQTIWLGLKRTFKVAVGYPLISLAIAWVWHALFMPAPN